MASTYALPAVSASRTHSHGRTRSQYAPSPGLHPDRAISGTPPAKANAHRHSHSYVEMNTSGQLYGAVRSPYAEYNGSVHDHEHDHNHNHDHGHAHSHSTDSTYSLKPFANGRPNGGARVETDLGRSPQRKAASARRYGFSPIQESAPHPPPVAASS